MHNARVESECSPMLVGAAALCPSSPQHRQAHTVFPTAPLLRLPGEKEEAAKREAKLQTKQARLREAAAMGVAAPKKLKRKAKKGVRVRKHVVVRVRSRRRGAGCSEGACAAWYLHAAAMWRAPPLALPPTPRARAAAPRSPRPPPSCVVAFCTTQGVKVTDAESRKKIKEILAAEEAMKARADARSTRSWRAAAYARGALHPVLLDRR